MSAAGLLLALAASAVAPLVGSCAPGSDPAACAVILQAEAALAGMLVTGDPAPIARHLAEDGVWTTASGESWSKAEAMRRIAAGPRHATARVERADVRVIDTVAIVRWRESWTDAGSSGAMVGTDTWLKRRGRWQIVATQESHPPR